MAFTITHLKVSAVADDLDPSTVSPTDWNASHNISGSLAASEITSPAALTKTDDTNVTLTLGGSPTVALLATSSLTLGWTGALAAARGGTGLSSLGAGVATFLGTPSSANLAAAVTDETGSGSLVFSTALAPIYPQGRLTLTSGTAVTTADVSGATIIYWTPSGGRFIPIYNGTQFINSDYGAELSNDSTQSSTGKAGPAAMAASKCYFLLVWSDSGTYRLTRSPAWTSDTNPGTGAGTAEIELVSGIWVNKQSITNGPAAQRGTIVGGVRSNASSQMVDSEAFRWVSNIYNSVPRSMQIIEATNSWNYTLAAWRQANASTANQLDWFHALGGAMVDITVFSTALNSTAGPYAMVSVDIDDVVAPDTPHVINNLSAFPVANYSVAFSAFYKGYPGQGRHFGAWIEQSAASGVTTWIGDGNNTLTQSGMLGSTWN